MTPAPNIVARVIAFEAGLGVLAVALAWALGISFVDQLLVTPKTATLGIAGAVPMVVAMAILAVIPWSPSREIIVRVRDLVMPLFRESTVLQLGVIALAAGVGEELLFRGVMQTAATRVTGAAAAIVLTSVVFGVAHALTPLYAILAAFISAYLGWMMVATDSLVPPIVAHALYDWIALIYIVRYDRGGR
jgi:CAAX protease family protein